MTSTNNALDNEDTHSWRGCPLNEIYWNQSEFATQHMSPVKTSEVHTVLFELPLDDLSENVPPRPRKSEPKWDWCHVRLPCSTESKYSSDELNEHSGVKLRWDIVKEALSRPITNSLDLQQAILTYNYRYKDQWDFKALHKFFDEDVYKQGSKMFFDGLLPRIIQLALQITDLIQVPIPLLKRSLNHSVSLSQQQVSCLLANAFLCTFPDRNYNFYSQEYRQYANYHQINFNGLFQSRSEISKHKIKAILHYFHRVCPNGTTTTNVPRGVVTFARRSLDESMLPDWSACSDKIGSTPFHISPASATEYGKGLLQTGFSKTHIGGDILYIGCELQDIHFIICPELIVMNLFAEWPRENEAVFISGCEQFSDYTGYSETFKWIGNFADSTPQDSSRRRMRHFVDMYSVFYGYFHRQYLESNMLLELNSLYTGFLHELDSPAPGIAAGNWERGNHCGHRRLKVLLKLMASTATKRPLVYYTYGDSELLNDVYDLYQYLKQNNVRICDLWDVLRQVHSKKLRQDQLYSFIKQNVLTRRTST